MNSDIDRSCGKGTFVILSLGANLGEKKKTISKAIEYLVNSEALHDVKNASFYETEPVGYKQQDWFVNTAISGYTNMPVFSLINLCKSIEYSLGRTWREKWHEREIDIDILIYGSQEIKKPSLTVPHPRMYERRFVMEPVAEIAGSVVDPVSGRTMQQLLDSCQDTAAVIKQ